MKHVKGLVAEVRYQLFNLSWRHTNAEEVATLTSTLLGQSYALELVGRRCAPCAALLGFPDPPQRSSPLDRLLDWKASVGKGWLIAQP